MIKPKMNPTPQLKHKVVITPQLQQAINVLGMPQGELKQFIALELEENPLLEIKEEYETVLLEEAEANEYVVDVHTKEEAVDVDWELVLNDRISTSEWTNTRYAETDEPSIDIAAPLSLHDYLMEQLQHGEFDEIESLIAEHILGNLNDDGQLQLKLFEIPRKFERELDKRNISRKLHTVIEKNLQNVTGDSTKWLSSSATVQLKTPDAVGDGGRWKIIDCENRNTYTIVTNGTAPLDFYQLTLEDIAEEVGCDVAMVEQVLRKIQNTFEPVGIAYRDVREALLIQIRNYDATNSDEPHPLAEAILENHFTGLLHQQLDEIAEALGVDISEVQDAKRWIGTLSPYPGRGFSHPNTSMARNVGATGAIDYAVPILPDVEIRRVDFGAATADEPFHVIIADDDIPRLKLNSYYVNLLQTSSPKLDSEAKAWIEERYRDASYLMNSIAHRERTIVRVTKAIFEEQSKFLTEGISGIGPLTLSTIAERIGVHESTVSRVTSNKYVETPYGLYPLRFFFSNEVTTAHGEGVSARQVKVHIKKLIQGEVPETPLSDQAVSDALKSKGIHIARRTVQKYREELGIPSSRQRRQRRSAKV